METVPKMKYVVAGNAVADCITYADGYCAGFRPGGATLFALTGFQLFTDEVLLVGGFGADYMDQLGDYLERNPNIDQSGFHVRDPHHPVNYLHYRDEGSWDSRTAYGNAHYDNLCCNPDEDHLRDFLSDTVGLHTFRGEDTAFFAQLFALKKEFGFGFGWEIRANMATPEKMPLIREILAKTEAFSINRPEAYTLFGAGSDEEATRALQALNLPLVVYRVGEEGLYILMRGKRLFAESYKKFPVTDVTGCGNTSTASAFYAFWEGMDIYDIAAHANIAAAYNLRVYGAMDVSSDNRREALQDTQEFSEILRRKP